MKFLIDAQLPLRLSDLLAEAKHDSIHTSSLPDGNRTGDRQLADIADSENRVVVTKDRDFRDSHLLQNLPRRLLVVATGNIANDDLLASYTQKLWMRFEEEGGVPSRLMKTEAGDGRQEGTPCQMFAGSPSGRTTKGSRSRSMSSLVRVRVG